MNVIIKAVNRAVPFILSIGTWAFVVRLFYLAAGPTWAVFTVATLLIPAAVQATRRCTMFLDIFHLERRALAVRAQLTTDQARALPKDDRNPFWALAHRHAWIQVCGTRMTGWLICAAVADAVGLLVVVACLRRAGPGKVVLLGTTGYAVIIILVLVAFNVLLKRDEVRWSKIVSQSTPADAAKREISGSRVV